MNLYLVSFIWYSFSVLVSAPHPYDPDSSSGKRIKLHRETDTFPATVILYHAFTLQYAFTDTDTVQQLNFFPTPKPTHVIITCSAESQNEEVFQKNVNVRFKIPSHIKTVLFLRHVYRNIASIDPNIRCEAAPNPSIIRDPLRETYMIGYKIDRNDHLWKRNLEFFSSYTLITKEIHWLPQITISYDRTKIRTVYTRHTLHAELHRNDYSLKCENFDFGMADIPHDSPKTYYAQAYGRIAHLMTPVQDFNSIYASQTVCTYLNVAMLRNFVSEGPMRTVEKFIRKVADVLGKIDVITGAIYDDDASYAKNLAPMPCIIYKLLQHEIVRPEAKYSYSILIAVHNEISHSMSNKLCPKSVCLQNGWDVVSEPFPELVYCCLLDADIEKTIGISVYRQYQPFDLSDVALSINNVGHIVRRMNVVQKLKISPLILWYTAEDGDYVFGDQNVTPDRKAFPRTPRILLSCPAETKSEENLCDSKSELCYPNFLIIRDILQYTDVIPNQPECRREIQPSVRRYERDGVPIYEFGYELLAKDSMAESVTQILQKIKHNFKGVYWLPYIKIGYHDAKLSLKFTQHMLRGYLHSDDYTIKCDYFELFKVVLSLTAVSIETIYSQTNQEHVLSRFFIRYPPPYGYLVPHLLIPLQDFKGIYAEQIACTYLNVVPLWERVSTVAIREVEKFARKVADIVGKLKILSGTYGVMTLHDDKDIEIYMYGEFVPVPKIVWKIFQHQINVGEQTISRAILIAVHNEPTRSINEKLCEKSVCRSYAWSITDSEDEDPDIGLTYCCRFTEQIAEKLQIPFDNDVKPFMLRLVPTGVDERGEVVLKNLFNMLEQRSSIMLYHVDDNTYTFTDIDHVRDLKFTPITNKPSHIVVTCPATNGPRKWFARNIGQQNVLVVQNLYQNIDRQTRFNKCEREIRPSITYLEGYKHYTIGFWIELPSKQMKDMKYQPPYYNESSSELEVYWFHYATFEYDTHSYNLISTTHDVYAYMNNDDYELKCDNYDLGSQYFRDIDMQEIYTERYQEELYQFLTAPIPPAYGYFVKYHLVPLQDFNDSSTRAGLCTYLNVTPVLQEIAEGLLRKIDEFIRKVANIIGKVTVQSGTLTPISYLDQYSDTKRVVISKIIWKLVSYKIDKFQLYEYGILLVVHNEPLQILDKIDKDNCAKEICVLYGWDLPNPNPEVKAAYCCLLDKRIGEKIDTKISPAMQPFDLKAQLPWVVDDNNTIQRTIAVYDYLDGKKPLEDVFDI